MPDSTNKTKSQPSKDIFPTEAWEWISKNGSRDNPVILDVSTPGEYKDRHLEGAVNINLFSKLFKARLDVMDKRSTYLVYCKLGGRSKIAQRLMQRSGFQNVYNVIGGTLLWEEEGLPFAPELGGVRNLSFCPFFISIVLFRKTRSVLRNTLSRFVQRKGVGASANQES